MSNADRQRWDSIYRQQKRFPEPDAFLFEYTPPASGSREQRALDLAGGMGQNGLWLAEQGYVVDVLDISRMALVRGRGEMVRRGVRNINFLLSDLDEAEFDANKYALVCVFRYLKHDLFPQLRACIQPGGRIIYETYNLNYLNHVPQFNPDFLLKPGELAGYFYGWKILYDNEADHITRFVAIKPDTNE
jgi:2-polyprenyl-3-methyl-5-hydroxy-6-metoxy-1,4-benzoquinol methylase